MVFLELAERLIRLNAENKDQLPPNQEHDLFLGHIFPSSSGQNLYGVEIKKHRFIRVGEVVIDAGGISHQSTTTGKMHGWNHVDLSLDVFEQIIVQILDKIIGVKRVKHKTKEWIEESNARMDYLWSAIHDSALSPRWVVRLVKKSDDQSNPSKLPIRVLIQLRPRVLQSPDLVKGLKVIDVRFFNFFEEDYAQSTAYAYSKKNDSYLHQELLPDILYESEDIPFLGTLYY